MMSGPNSSDLKPPEYQVWGQRWSRITGCNGSQKTCPRFKDAIRLIWSALSEKAIDAAVKDYCK